MADQVGTGEHPTVETAWRDAILILLAHGSSMPSGADMARKHAETLRELGLFADVRAAFLRDTPHPRDLIEAEDARDIYVVPFMASDGYSIDTLIPEALGLSGPLTERISEGTRRRIHMCRPVGTHEDLLNWQVGGLCRFIDSLPAKEKPLSVLVAAHGTDRHAGNFDRTRDVVAVISAAGIAETVDAVFIDQSPSLDTWRDHVRTDTVLVVPYLMNLGRHGRHDIPEAMGFAGRGASTTLAEGSIAGPYDVDGNRMYYGPLLGACPSIPQVTLERVRQWDAPWHE
ncbi:MAG: CbiX/SirB N-terminal domain-containing protein [Rhodospirillales bacterium]